ncbi:MAG: hypothetical protein WD030_08215 [Pirellulales bacterium]
MPATEQTWRDMKLMHVVFGVSSIILLLSTIWLLAKDHNREWKQYARTSRDIQAFTIASQISEEETDRYSMEHERLAKALAGARNDIPSAEQVEAFAQVALDDDSANAAEEAGLKSIHDALEPVAQQARQLRARADQLDNEALDARSQSLDANEKASAAAIAAMKAGGAEAEQAAAAEQAAKAEAERLQEHSRSLHEAASKAAAEAAEAEQKVDALRSRLFGKMRDYVAGVKFVEDTLAGKLKFRRADLDAARSRYDLGIRDAVESQELEKYKQEVAEIESGNEQSVAAYSSEYEDAKLRREALEGMLREMTDEEQFARKALDDHIATLERLRQSQQERGMKGIKNLLTLPILDAFGSPLRIEQIWLPELTLNNNFRDVARFDRCITCHQGINATEPGSATLPAYHSLEPNRLTILATPEEKPSTPRLPNGTEVTDEAEIERRQLQDAYGLELAARGLLDPNDVTIEVVWPNSRAARAGLQRGDVIRAISMGGRFENVINRQMVVRHLLRNVDWGNPVEMRVDRGLPQPYSSHPRLDLFVGSLSPHPMMEVGCTICHEGQGSATEFKFASHTPNTLREANDWASEHGWFDNHHWILPMKPARFAESSCVKCHHQLEELEPSERFPEPPAPKLMSGFNAVERFGCFGCHEVNGYSGPDARQGPDLRLEPNFTASAQQLRYFVPARIQQLKELEASDESAVAPLIAELENLDQLAEQLEYHPEYGFVRQQVLEFLEIDGNRASAPAKLLGDPGLVGEGRQLAQRLRDNPFDFEARTKLSALVEADAAEPAGLLNATSHDQLPYLAAPPRLPADARRLTELFKPVETPGTRRRVGPSLRYVDSKLDHDVLIRWIADPTDIRPSTTMPKFFGLTDHLQDSPEALKLTEEFEPIEIRATAEYLIDKSQPFDYLQPATGVTEEPDAERGKLQFETRGCLACHTHDGTPGSSADQGPSLTDLREKLGTEKGAQWLYTWLRNPESYHRRTKMPDTFLLPEGVRAADGTVEQTDDGEPKQFDPAADIALYLLGSDLPADGPAVAELTAAESESLHKLTLSYLESAFPKRDAEKFAKEGIPMELAPQLVGSEIELLGAIDDHARLQYIGARTIGKLGCFACHDIPGFEDGKPIGATLADWGRKETSKLAFEHITEYLGKYPPGHDHSEAAHGGGHSEGGHHLNPEDFDADTGYFVQALLSHSREGFLWQKLREPRSYDYEKADFKGYNERLRMPKFPLTDDDVEDIMTFVLGLVAEPPASQYVYQPDQRQQAIVEGRKVLNKFNCGGCHSLQTDTWNIDFLPGDFPPSFPPDDFAFLDRQWTPAEVLASKTTDRRGFLEAHLKGYPIRSSETGELVVADEDGIELEGEELEDPEIEKFYKFQLWDPVLLDGSPRTVGSGDLQVPVARSPQMLSSDSGYLARLIFPLVVAEELSRNPNVNPQEAWGWLPPPLVGEGKKVQTDWLHKFLLEPHPIRPAAVMRMPKFNMSSDEAAALVNYFAAMDNVQFPYEYNERQGAAYMAKLEDAHPQRLGDAMNIVANACIQCHSVGDFQPAGAPVALAPNLDDIHARMRPEYLRRWIANPKRILPYTPMPVNMPKGQPLNQDWFPGDSLEQIDGTVDLLMNYNRFVRERTSVAEILEGKVQAPAEETTASDPPEAASAEPPAEDESATGQETTPGENTQTP